MASPPARFFSPPGKLSLRLLSRPRADRCAPAGGVGLPAGRGDAALEQAVAQGYPREVVDRGAVGLAEERARLLALLRGFWCEVRVWPDRVEFVGLDGEWSEARVGVVVRPRRRRHGRGGGGDGRCARAGTGAVAATPYMGAALKRPCQPPATVVPSTRREATPQVPALTLQVTLRRCPHRRAVMALHGVLLRRTCPGSHRGRPQGPSPSTSAVITNPEEASVRWRASCW